MVETGDDFKDQLVNAFGLRHDQIQALQGYADLLTKWNAAYNLVGPAELNRLWSRHIMDSLQLIPHLPQRPSFTLYDLGSGAGFPGLILAMTTTAHVTLFEKSRKKCQFLQTVIQSLGLECAIITARIEDVEGIEKADIITSRALASLEKLLEFSIPFLKETTQCLFLKGEKVEEELKLAQQSFRFNYETCEILKIWNIQEKTSLP